MNIVAALPQGRLGISTDLSLFVAAFYEFLQQCIFRKSRLIYIHCPSHCNVDICGETCVCRSDSLAQLAHTCDLLFSKVSCTKIGTTNCCGRSSEHMTDCIHLTARHCLRCQSLPMSTRPWHSNTNDIHLILSDPYRL
jgi:hypothetical protein